MTIFPISYTEKIVNKIPQTEFFPGRFLEREIDHKELENLILKGYSWTPGIFEYHARKKENFISTKVAAVDFDGRLSLEEALMDRFIGKNASLIYTSISHTTELNRFRVIFYFHKELKSYEYSLFLKWMFNKFPMMDSGSKDICKLYAGNTNAEIPLSIDRVIPEALLNRILKEQEENEIRNANNQTPLKTKYSEFIDDDYLLQEKCQYALKIIPDKNKKDGRRDEYLTIISSLLTAFPLDEVINLVEPKIHPESNLKIRSIIKSIKPSPYGIGPLINLAKKYGWDWSDFYSENKDTLIKYIPKVLPLNKKANIEITQDYLSNSKILYESLSKNNIIQSLQGTGKTKFILDYLKDKRFVIVINRISLCEDYVNTLNSMGVQAKLYSDVNRLNSFSGNLVICVNSLYRIKPNLFNDYTIVIDEVDQVIQQLFSDICKDHREDIFINLSKLLNNAEKTFFLSADIPRYTLSFIKKTVGLSNINHIYNRYIPYTGRTATIYDNRESLVEEIEKTIDNDEKCTIGCFTKEFANRLANTLRNKFPYKKIVLITQDSKDVVENSLILEDKEKFNEIDIFIYTSVIGTGKDFSFDFSKKNFLFADNNRTLNHFEGFQMLSRFRKFNDLHAFIMPSRREDDIQIQKVYFAEESKSLIQKFNKFRRLYKLQVSYRNYNLEEQRRMIKEWGIFVFNSFLCKIENQYWRSKLKYNLIKLLGNRGYSIDFKKTSKEQRKQLNKIAQLETRAFKKEEIQKILEAKIFDEYGQLMRHLAFPSTEDQIYAAYKVRLYLELRLEGDDKWSMKELEYFIKKGISIKKLEKYIKNCLLLYHHKGFAIYFDAVSRKSGIITDHTNNNMKRFYLVKLIQRIPKDIYKSSNLSELVSYCTEHREEIDRVLHKFTDSSLKKPVILARSILGFFGISQIKRKRVTRKRIEQYSINLREVCIMRKICRRISSEYSEVSKNVDNYFYTGEIAS